MVDFLLDFIDFNNDVPNYGLIIPTIITYLAVLWLIVSIWVYFDARKRFQRFWIGLLIAVLNLLLQFPFLFVYLLIRPHTQDDIDDWVEGGVNVPLVNFTGKDGIELSLELRVYPKRLARHDEAEMKVDVSFESNDQQKQIVTAPEVIPTIATAVKPPSPPTKSRLRTLISSLNGRIKAVKDKFTERVPIDAEKGSPVGSHADEDTTTEGEKDRLGEVDITMVSVDHGATEEGTQEISKQKKKKKKKKKRKKKK